MTGWLVVNGFTDTEKFNELWAMLESAAHTFNIQLFRKKHTEVWLELCKNDYKMNKSALGIDFVLFWDKDIRLAKELEKNDIWVLNSSKAIAVCDDKAETFLALMGSGIRQPKTFISGKQYRSCSDYTIYMEAANLLGYPVIVKECMGSFGAQVYLANDEEELKSIIEKIDNRGFIIQEFIGDRGKTMNARDIRIQVVGERIVAAMERTNEGDYRANITNGGSMKPYQPTKVEQDMALSVVKCLGLDFGGIDILFDADGEPVFCEANSNAHFKNLFDCTGVNTAEYIMEYIIEKLKK